MHFCSHWHFSSLVFPLTHINQKRLEQELPCGKNITLPYINFKYEFYSFRYWWLYGVNFIIYFLTSPRIRQAYLKFLEDIVCSKITKEKIIVEQSDTYWARGMDKGCGDHELEERPQEPDQ